MFEVANSDTTGRKSMRGSWEAYRSIGAAMPQAIHPNVFREQLRALPSRGVWGSELRGLLNYELGVNLHGERAPRAAAHFNQALMDLSIPKPRSVDNTIRHNTLVVVAELLFQRTYQQERIHNQAQIFAVRKLGELLVQSSHDVYGTRRARGETYGALAETAIAATFLAHMQSDKTYVGAPTTLRQDWAYTTHWIPKKDGPSIRTAPREGSDINLYVYQGTEIRPIECARVQVKAREVGVSKQYADDILLLYADRELFIDGFEEMAEYGSCLAEYDGAILERPLEVALSNLDLALSLRQAEQPFQAWELNGY